MLISRNEAIILASFLKMLALSEKDRCKELENALCDKGIDDESAIPDKGLFLREYIQLRFERYTNRYIGDFISSRVNSMIELTGSDVELLPCPCCGYRTLVEQRGYDICSVCFWEDDGTSDEDKYSAPNRMILKEARQNFKKLGVMNQAFLNSVDPDRMMQYAFVQTSL